MSTVKYPAEPTYQATVASTPLVAKETEQSNACAKCFMTTLCIIFTLLGLVMIGVATYVLVELTYGGSNVLVGAVGGSVYTLLIVGLVLFAVSVIVWVSTCRPTAVCSKIVLVLFAIVMIVLCLVQLALLIFGALWVNHVPLNITGAQSVDQVFAEAVDQLKDLCCSADNTTETICREVFHNDTAWTIDCVSQTKFYDAVVEFLTKVMTGVLIFLGVVAFFNLLAFICSCCLVCSRKRTAYYKPTTYTSE